jgi:putative flavoprotein involved in K+ transport
VVVAPRSQQIATVVIGAGHAGLATSWELRQRQVEHVVLDRGNIGQAWRDRWDSLCMVLPNWYNTLPGMPYAGSDPDGFQTRDEWVANLERYASQYSLPVQTRVNVNAVRQAEGDCFHVETTAGDLITKNLVVATGGFQIAKLPDTAGAFPGDVVQLHSSAYRNPTRLPPGAILVVGTGNSGSQIAEELYKSGRTVFLSVGYSGFPLRRYRGRDVYWWWIHAGMEALPSDRKYQGGFANFTGRNGGRALNLHQFARDGVVLLGRIRGCRSAEIQLAPDLRNSLAAIDRRAESFRQAVDAYIEKTGINAPAAKAPAAWSVTQDYRVRTVIDLRREGVSSVVWATGYGWNLRWVDAQVTDELGVPRNAAGCSPVDGLFFAGMSLTAPNSRSIGRVGAEAARIADAIASRLSL